MVINGAVKVPCKDLSALFRSWVEFLTPIHKLTDRQMDVLASYLKQRYELSKKINDTKILDREVMSEYTKQEVIKECGLTTAHFQVIMGKLRAANVIGRDRINPKFVPNIVNDQDSVKLLILFEKK